MGEKKGDNNKKETNDIKTLEKQTCTSHTSRNQQSAITGLEAETLVRVVADSSGFWHIPLDPETAKLTTFITAFGRLITNQPSAVSSAPEIF